MGQAKPVILVVEDDALLRMCAADMLEENGFGVVEAENADAALKLLETRDDVRLLFTDIQMPGSCDGMDLATGSRSLATHPLGHHFRSNSARSGGNSRSRPLHWQTLQSEGSARRSERYDAQSLGQVDGNTRETSPLSSAVLNPCPPGGNNI
jgi:CheY-like chemotaxis protein